MRKLYKPAFYDSFHCIASLCPDTCCQQWDIDIDPDTEQLYRRLPGPLGEKIRASISLGEDGPIFAVREDGHCPMHRQDGLCSVQAALGEEGLCRVCREFPRLRHDYGDFVELGLEMSCPEAARILLTAPSGPAAVTELPDSCEPDYDEEAMSVLRSTRLEALTLLEEDRPAEDTLTLLFFFGCHAQALLDGEEPGDFSPEAALQSAEAMARPGDLRALGSFFLGLDLLTDRWKQLLSSLRPGPLSPLCRQLCRYLVGRYWLQAVSDYDLYCRVKFMVITCVLLSSLPGDFIDNAHLWSKEIENDCENLEALLDAAYESPVFTDDRLLGLVRHPL